MSDEEQIAEAYARGGNTAVVMWWVRELFAAIGCATVLVTLIYHHATGRWLWACLQ